MVFDNFAIKYSIIVPCYNESIRLKQKMKYFLEIFNKRSDVEIIFVDDGSIDGTRNVIPILERVKIVSYDNNAGKWEAIKRGWLVASGRYCVLSDADYSYDILEFIDYVEKYGYTSGILIGNRYNSINEIPFGRWFASRMFNVMARVICGITVDDSQSPAKIWDNSVAMMRVWAQMNESGFAGDVEFLVLCKKYNGITAMEVDIPYVAQQGSTVSVRKHSLKMFHSLIRIRNRWC